MSSISFERESVPGLVSVIIPTHANEKYIGATLETIGRQSYANWEVIVVEDGSTGPTRRIVEEFACRHPQHRVEYSRNDRSYGPSHSRNLAFAKAAGEYVALLDSDDLWFPDHLEASVEKLTSTGADVVYSTVLMIEDETELLLGVWGPDASELRGFPQSLFGRSFVTPSATVMRRQVIADVGGWNVELRRCEDFEYWLRSVAVGKKFQHVGGIHCLYRKNHAGALTGKMCATLEAVAQVSERFVDIPGVRRKSCVRLVARSYALASKVHHRSDPQRDPSADRSRAPKLMFKAWRLRPTHLDYLYYGVKQTVANAFRRKSQTNAVPAPPVEVRSRRAAA